MSSSSATRKSSVSRSASPASSATGSSTTASGFTPCRSTRLADAVLGAIRLYGTAVLAAVPLLLLLPFRLAWLAVGGRAGMAVARLWQRFVCRLIGIRVTVSGAPAAERPLLLLANHTSWLDIPILAGIAPVSFIAKKEVAGWPVVGFLAKAQR